MISIKINFLTLCVLWFWIMQAGASFADEPFDKSIYAYEPDFTGPIISAAATTVPNGHNLFDTSIMYINNDGFYSDTGKLVLTPNQQNLTIDPIFARGISDTMDVQITLPYTIIYNANFTYDHLSDISVILGYQMLKQGQSWLMPNLRFTVQEIIPSGKYDNLNPVGSGADGNGLGSYQTGLSLNFQRLIPLTAILTEDNYLSAHLNLAYFYAANVQLHGRSVYGGNTDTRGTFMPGQQFSADIAFELSLMRHLSLVLEGFLWNRSTSTFLGTLGHDSLGNNADIQLAPKKQVTYAPAIEYSYNKNFGIIAGYWFSTKGKNSSDFNSYVIALNFYF